MENNTPKTSSLIIDHLKRLENSPFGRYAIHIQMSKLQPENQKPLNFRHIYEIFQDLIETNKGRLFNLINDDIMFFYEEPVKDEVEAFKIKINFLFADDPFLAEASDDDEDKFIVEYSLHTDFNKLLETVKKCSVYKNATGSSATTESLTPKPTQPQSQPNVKEIIPNPPPPRKGEPLTPAMLAKVEKSLLNTDFANMIRRQSVCAIVGKALPQTLFDEVFVSIADLREAILPEVNFALTPWLFQHMTETLDKKVLSNINKHDDGTLNSNFSINLNVSTVLSNDFLLFDDNINASMRSTIVIEMQLVDIFSDLASYILARDFAKERGYRICIDGISLETIPYVDRLKLGADMVKIIWNQDLADALAKNPQTIADIKRIGGGRIIFCRVDDAVAVEVGQGFGVTMFQGRYVQRLMFSDPRKKRVGSVMVK